ncbi:MAG: YbhB/YbcL family Raf kinase inhibitor-like protein [Thermoanaerobaculia bacterium]
MKLESPAFPDGGSIPRTYTCDGRDVSPPLSWTDLPAGARTLALICDDPDAPAKTWVHWVLFDLPVSVGELPEGVPSQPELLGGRQGTNDFHKIGYGGPCPPSGTHRYFFKLYALASVLALPAGATKAQVEKAIEGQVLADASLMGRYSRG